MARNKIVSTRQSVTRSAPRGGRIDAPSTFDGARIMESLDIPSGVSIDSAQVRTGDAVFAPIPVGDAILIGRATDPRGFAIVHYLVTAQRHDRVWPGTDQSVTFAVSRVEPNAEGRYEALFSWGFFHEIDCFSFLTGKRKARYQVWDLRGNEDLSEWRQGIGLPDGMVERIADEVG